MDRVGSRKFAYSEELLGVGDLNAREPEQKTSEIGAAVNRKLEQSTLI